MRGRRFPDGEYVDEPGGYSKLEIDGEVCWLIQVPTGGPNCIIGRRNPDGSDCHWVREEEDGSITVQPHPTDAPPDRCNSNSIGWNGWHGYIDHGVWSPV